MTTFLNSVLMINKLSSHSSREIYCKILTCGSLIFTAAWLHQPCFVTSLTKSPVTVPLGELIWTLSGVDKFFLSNLHPNFKSLMSFSAMITKVSYMTLQGALHNVVKVYPCTKSDQYISKWEFLDLGIEWVKDDCLKIQQNKGSFQKRLKASLILLGF